jgi:hypothetical protein
MLHRLRAISTLSAGIAYPASPTASRASCGSEYMSIRTSVPSRSVQTWSEPDPVAEVEGFLHLDLELLVRADPVLTMGANCRQGLVGTKPYGRVVPYGVGTKDAYGPVQVTAIHSFNVPAHKLDEVGGCGLFSHRSVSIPLTGQGHDDAFTPCGNVSVAWARLTAKRGRCACAHVSVGHGHHPSHRQVAAGPCRADALTGVPARI